MVRWEFTILGYMFLILGWIIDLNTGGIMALVFYSMSGGFFLSSLISSYLDLERRDMKDKRGEGDE